MLMSKELCVIGALPASAGASVHAPPYSRTVVNRSA